MTDTETIRLPRVGSSEYLDWLKLEMRRREAIGELRFDRLVAMEMNEGPGELKTKGLA